MRTTPDELLNADAMLRPMLDATSIDFENTHPDAVRDMWILAKEWMEEHPDGPPAIRVRSAKLPEHIQAGINRAILAARRERGE